MSSANQDSLLQSVAVVEPKITASVAISSKSKRSELRVMKQQHVESSGHIVMLLLSASGLDDASSSNDEALRFSLTKSPSPWDWIPAEDTAICIFRIILCERLSLGSNGTHFEDLKNLASDEMHSRPLGHVHSF